MPARSKSIDSVADADTKSVNHLSFGELARWASHAFGSGWAFWTACAVVLTWAITGPLFGFSDAWQLVINTGTTIVTFLMVFLIQNTQNRDARAKHLKLDELIRSTNAARNKLIDLENCTDQELDEVQREFERLKGRIGAARERKPVSSNAAPHR
jgi:low affinity Fe/Cu permease